MARQSGWQHPPWRVVLHGAARPASLRAHQHLQVSVLLMLPGVTVLLHVLVSNFYILKALDTLSARLFGCFHNPPNSDLDYGIFGMRVLCCYMRVHTGDLGS